MILDLSHRQQQHVVSTNLKTVTFLQIDSNVKTYVFQRSDHLCSNDIYLLPAIQPTNVHSKNNCQRQNPTTIISIIIIISGADNLHFALSARFFLSFSWCRSWICSPRCIHLSICHGMQSSAPHTHPHCLHFYWKLNWGEFKSVFFFFAVEDNVIWWCKEDHRIRRFAGFRWHHFDSTGHLLLPVACYKILKDLWFSHRSDNVHHFGTFRQLCNSKTFPKTAGTYV